MDFSNLFIVMGLTLVMAALIRVILKPNNKNIIINIGLGEHSFLINKAAVGFVCLLLIGFVLQIVGILFP